MPAVDRFLYFVSRGLARLTGDRVRLVRYHLVAQPVPDAPRPANARRTRFTFRRAASVDAVIASAPRPRAVLEQRLREGAACIVAECDGQLAGFVWLAERAYMEDEVRCLFRLDPHAQAAWDFDVYVAPAYRATRVFAQLWDAAHALSRERGHRWTFSRISGFNPASLAAHRRLGAADLGRATFLVLGPLQLSFFSIAPYVHVALSRRAHPTVKLPAALESLTLCDTRTQ